MTENKPPFKVVKRGNSKLKWGYHPDGRFWVHSVCVECGCDCPITVGREGGGTRGPSGRTLQVRGYWAISYTKQRKTHKTKRGWSTMATHTVTKINDWCPSCSLELNSLTHGLLGSNKITKDQLKNPDVILFWHKALKLKRLVQRSTHLTKSKKEAA